VPCRIRPRLVERSEAGEPLEVAPGREDGTGATGFDLVQDLSGRRPEQANRFSFGGAALARRRFRQEEERVETPGFLEVGAPARETASAPKCRAPGPCASTSAENGTPSSSS
jgi:hypothetical protein